MLSSSARCALGGRKAISALPRAVAWAGLLEPMEQVASRAFSATALGKALIAFLPPKAQRTLIDNIELTSYTDQTISSKEGFIAQLEQIKKQGYATEFAELGHLTACCSVPILDSQGNAVAAISLADIAESNENYLQMANDLKAAAAEISKIVAYTQN